MNRTTAIIVTSIVALAALSPVLYMVFFSLYVESVVIRPDVEGGLEGYRSGVVVETKPIGAREVRLRIDRDYPVSAILVPGTGVGHAAGDHVFFSPPPDVLKHEPHTPVTLYREQPKARMVLWARGVLSEISPTGAVINAELLEDLVVPIEAISGFAIEPGKRIHFRPERTFSLMNYQGLFKEIGPFFSALFRWVTFRKAEFPKRMGLLFHTLLVAGLASLLATCVGVTYAMCIAKFDMPGRRFFSWIYVAPLLIPPYITAIAWTLVLGEQGSWTKIIKAAFSLEKAPFTCYGVPGSVLVLGLTFFPIVTLLTQAGLRAVHREQEEAALLAHGRYRALWRVSLRLSAPYILSGAVFVFVFCLSSSGAPALLRLQLYSSQVMVAFQTDLSGGEAMATGTPLVLAAVAAVIVQGIAHGRRRFATTGGQPRVFSLSRLGKAAALSISALIWVLAAGVPLWVLVRQAGSFDAFKTALIEMRADIIASVVIAALAATGAALLGSAVGYAAARVRRGTAIEVLAILPYAAPAAVVGSGLMGIWNRPAQPFDVIYLAGGAMVIASMTRFIPFAVQPAAAAVRSIDPSLEEAARVHGASRLRTTLRVVAPLGMRGFLAGWILVFVLSLGELDASILVAPAGITTAPIRIFNAIHFGRVEVVSALCLILVFLSALPLMLYSLITARKLDVM